MTVAAFIGHRLPSRVQARLGPFLRGQTSAALCALAGVCVTHGCLLYGWHEISHRIAVKDLMIAALLHCLGSLCLRFQVRSCLIGSWFVLIWKTKLPERYRPRMFDIFGASHQIFHVTTFGVVLISEAALYHASFYVHYTPPV